MLCGVVVAGLLVVVEEGLSLVGDGSDGSVEIALLVDELATPKSVAVV